MSPDKTIKVFNSNMKGWTVERHVKYHGRYVLFARKDSAPGYSKWFSINPLTKSVSIFIIESDPDGFEKAARSSTVIVKKAPMIDDSQIKF